MKKAMMSLIFAFLVIAFGSVSLIANRETTTEPKPTIVMGVKVPIVVPFYRCDPPHDVVCVTFYTTIENGANRTGIFFHTTDVGDYGFTDVNVTIVSINPTTGVRTIYYTVNENNQTKLIMMNG